jgi:glyoxylase-like metal-dependent hydrolase (beta-lactamase superfamily II)
MQQMIRNKPEVKGFYESHTGSIQYVVSDTKTGQSAIIDPVLDFDERSRAMATRSADAILNYVLENGLDVEWILDTHPHADHFSAAKYLSENTGAPIGIGEHVVRVQELWKRTQNWEGFPTDGSQWDRLFKDGERFRIGQLDAEAILSPGHTPASITYVIGDAAFVHDTIFMPDSGTARADFPGGNASVLWKSIQRILSLPDETRLFTGHDYRPGGREARWESTGTEQNRSNPHLANKNEAEFVALRNARDKTLPMPKLMSHALPVNIAGGMPMKGDFSGGWASAVRALPQRHWR